MRKFLNPNLFLILLWIILLSLIPVYYSWGRLVIGGDVFIFFSSKGLEKYLYQWIPYHNGLNYPINYYPLYFLYKIAENFKGDPYQVSGFLFFILSFLAGIGIYKLTKLICGRTGLFMLVPITFYILSPARLNGWHYMYIYSTAPLFFYFVFKILKDNDISLKYIIWLNILIFFSSMDLPNPKYLFHMFVVMLTVVFFGLLFRLIHIRLLIRSWWKIVIFILLSAYIYFPLAHFYTQLTTIIPVKSGYQTTGRMPDYGYSTMNQMVMLHHKGVNINKVEADKYNSNPLVTVLSYAFFFLILINFIYKKGDVHLYKYELILFILILIFLFFACGPNPPFGFIYEYIVSNFVAFAFLRTTAGAVFFLSIFYAVLLGLFVQKIDKFQKQFILLFIIITGIVNYPYLNGEYFKNVNYVNQYTDREEHGFKIPQIYFDIVGPIDSQKLDAKYLHTRSNLNYMGTRWGYFGPSIYFFLYDNHNVSYDKIYSNLANHNIGYVFTDNSSVDVGKRFQYKTVKKIVDKSPIVIEKTSRDEFLPHLFTPQEVILTDKAIDDMYQIVDQPEYNLRSAIFINNKKIIPSAGSQNLKLQEKMPREIKDNPVLEFRRIDPTKYRIVVHKAQKDFLLVFSETFNRGWKAYITKSEIRNQRSEINSKLQLLNYQIIDNNEEDQATKEELIGFIDKGWISTLGDKKIDFVSKNFQDTIQNDNLQKGYFWETWLPQIKNQKSKIKNLFSLNKNIIQLEDENHQQVNVFANSWWIETEKNCQRSSFCSKNSDGSYDFEIIVEYWPQRIFYFGVIVSFIALLSSILYLTFKRNRDIVQIV